MAEALFHFDVGRVQPSKGHRLVKVAAYDAATVMVDDNGEAYDFRRKRKNDEYQTGFVVAAALDAAPELIADRERLWKAALAAETRRDGNSAILLEILIPDVIEYSEREDFARHVLARWIVDGAVAQVDLHQPLRSDGSGLRQPHAHAILSRRALGPEGFYGPKLGDEPFQKKNLKQTRSRVAADMNEWLARHGYDVRVDSRSNAERGIDIAPERNVSPRAVQVVRHAPDEAYVWPQVLKRRDDRRALRRARAEASEAETEFQTLMKEYDDARREAADHANLDTFSRRPTVDGDSRRDPRDPRGYSPDHRSLGRKRDRRRTGSDRPDSGGARRGADEPRDAARQSRPARNRHAEGVALGGGRRIGDNRLDEARARLRHADGRAEKARRRIRERAAFDGPRPALDDRVTEARHRLRDAGPPGVGPVSPHDRAARRRRHLAALLSEAYDTGWLPESVVANILHIEADGAAAMVALYLRDGSVIRDNGNRVHLEGAPTDVSVVELLAVAERHGWLHKEEGVEVSGSPAFRRAVALELLARRPPVLVVGLDQRDRSFVSDELARRERQRRGDALSALKLAEADVGRVPQIRSSGLGDMSALVAIRNAQAATVDGDERTIDAASRGAISDALEAATAWRSRQAATPEASGQVDAAPSADYARGYVPPWATGPRRRKAMAGGGG